MTSGLYSNPQASAASHEPSEHKKRVDVNCNSIMADAVSHSPAAPGEPSRTDLSPPLRILFVSIAPPIPATSGQRIRNRNLLRTIRMEGHRVTLMCFAEPDEIDRMPPELGEICEKVIMIPAPFHQHGWKQLASRLRALLTWEPYGL